MAESRGSGCLRPDKSACGGEAGDLRKPRWAPLGKSGNAPGSPCLQAHPRERLVGVRAIVAPRTAVASATTAAAVKAAVNPDGVRVPALPLDCGDADRGERGRAERRADLAGRAGQPGREACVSLGHRGGDDHGGGHEAERDADGDEQQPGQDRDQVAGAASVRAPATGDRRPAPPVR